MDGGHRTTGERIVQRKPDDSALQQDRVMVSKHSVMVSKQQCIKIAAPHLAPGWLCLSIRTCQG
jgi:hypothetical protein